MKVQLNGHYKDHLPGDVIDLDDETALRFIADNLVTAVLDERDEVPASKPKAKPRARKAV